MNSILSMLMIWIIMGIICSIVAKSKERNIYLWFFVGALFSILGLLVLLLMPKSKKGKTAGKSQLAPIRSMNSESSSAAEEESFYSDSEHVKRIKSDPTLLWYYIYESEDTIEIRGPLNLDALRIAVVTLKLQLNTYIWSEELSDWTQISEFQNSSYLMDKELIIGEGEEESYDEVPKKTNKPASSEGKEDIAESHATPAPDANNQKTSPPPKPESSSESEEKSAENDNPPHTGNND